MNRLGIRIQDLFDEKILRQKVEGALELKNQILTKIYNRRAVEVDEIVEELLSYVDRLRPMVADTPLLLHEALAADKTVLLEAGQATLLDVDHGTYPFVTSSSATTGGACTGSGIAPTEITRVIGIVKAYATRVGEGPFPTELFDDDGERLRKNGAEFGTTTGRPRRCGWYDAPIARYAARINGVTDFVLTKLDVLTGWDRIPVCVAYDVDGERVDEMPMTQTGFHHAKPIYEYFEGWHEDISAARTFEDLPQAAQDVRARAREDLGRADLHDRRRPGPRADHRAPRPALSTSDSEASPVKTLVIGTGGREHALALALSRDPQVTEVHAAPGNPGIAAVATLHDVDQLDGAAVAALAVELGADLVVVGPEAPLVAGVADAVRVPASRASARARLPRSSRAPRRSPSRSWPEPRCRPRWRTCARPPSRPRRRSTRSARHTSSRTTRSPRARASS